MEFHGVLMRLMGLYGIWMEFRWRNGDLMRQNNFQGDTPGEFCVTKHNPYINPPLLYFISTIPRVVGVTNLAPNWGPTLIELLAFWNSPD